MLWVILHIQGRVCHCPNPWCQLRCSHQSTSGLGKAFPDSKKLHLSDLLTADTFLTKRRKTNHFFATKFKHCFVGKIERVVHTNNSYVKGLKILQVKIKGQLGFKCLISLGVEQLNSKSKAARDRGHYC